MLVPFVAECWRAVLLGTGSCGHRPAVGSWKLLRCPRFSHSAEACWAAWPVSQLAAKRTVADWCIQEGVQVWGWLAQATASAVLEMSWQSCLVARSPSQPGLGPTLAQEGRSSSQTPPGSTGVTSESLPEVHFPSVECHGSAPLECHVSWNRRQACDWGSGRRTLQLPCSPVALSCCLGLELGSTPCSPQSASS